MKKSTLWLVTVLGCLGLFMFWQSAVGADSSDYSNWSTDMPKALAKAKAEHKAVFVDFTGSDWCPACKLVHKKVFVTKEFQDFASTNLVLMLVDFPNSKPQSDELKKANDALKDKYAIEGFPTLMLLDGDGKVLDRILGYDDQTPAAFIAQLKSKLPKS